MFTLIVPDLLRDEREPLPPLHTPALDKLLRFGRFGSASVETGGLYAPFLPELPENAVFVSPLWQQAGMNSVTQFSGSLLGIDESEAAQWCGGLNGFYGGDCTFTPLRPDLWQLTLPDTPQWTAPPVWEAQGQIDHLSHVEGSGRRQWLALQTEIAMWLSASVPTQKRSAAKLPPVNGVWLWNAPVATPPGCLKNAALIGSDSVWLANAENVESEPYDFAAWQQICTERGIAADDSVLLLDDLSAAASAADAWAYKDTLEQWDARLIAPALEAVRQGGLSGMCLMCGKGSLSLNARSHWAFWKPRRCFDGKTLR